MLFLFALVGVVIWFGGCTVSDKGTPLANQLPSAVLTFAPQDGDTVNHYIPIHWAGNDPDGVVAGFLLILGDSTGARDSVFTTSYDTTIAFAAPEDSVVVFHTFEVRAIDNEGAFSPIDSASNWREFYTVNYKPTAVFVNAGSVPNGASVGTGFRMTLKGSDPNPSALTFCVAIDTAANWICSSDSIFLFGSPTLDVQPEHTVLVPNDALTTGQSHIIYARVMDAGGAASSVISRTVNVEADHVPTLDTTVTGTYAGTNIYGDGSVYYAQNSETHLVWTANALAYHGEINAFRHQIGDSAWSRWISSSEIVFSDLPVGDYRMIVVARDLAGTLSLPDTFTLRIVEQHLTTQIVIVDETRNGTGVPGSPNDVQVDAFYDSLFTGLNTDHIDYSVQGYVSPLNLKDAGVVMWHADDKAEFRLADNTRILREFLDRGGRLILSGWDVMAPFSSTLDSVFFLTTSFSYTKLHSEWAVRNTSRTGTGFSGDHNYPGCQVDSLKVPASWHGTMDKLWTFRPRGEAIVIGRLTVSDPGTNPLVGRPAAYIYDLSFRVAVFGVPLYFCYTDQVYNLFRDPGNDPNFVGIVDQMLAGLSAN
jgi:hypothetical protein